MKSPMDAAVRRVQRTDAMFVQEKNKSYARQVLALDITLFVIAVGAWVSLAELHGWWRVAAGIIIGFQLGRSGITAFRRASAYRSGWLRGRSQFVMSMLEAQQRGIPPHDWLLLEASRDYAVLGLTPEDVANLHHHNPEE